METLMVSAGGKREKYEELLPQVAAVMEGETDMVANMANVSAMLMETFRFWWVGFYRVMEADGQSSPSEGSAQLVLGPFQGPLACTRIAFGRGVCGTAWKERRTLVVPDVDRFPGHIACSSASRSEIVVPLFSQGKVVAVLDIDSAELNTFDETDAHYLEQIARLFA